MAFIAQASDGGQIRYVDGKRYLWLLSLTSPIIPAIGVWLYFVAGNNPLMLALPLIYTFVGVPLLDLTFGEDHHNPPEEVVAAMSKDNYYRFLLYVAIALLYADFLVVAWFIGTHSVPWWAFITLTLATGFASSGSLLIGHELGHKANSLDRNAAQVVCAVVGYGHFCIEHNRGHHVQVATPEDLASSRMGESIYRFVRREIPGALKRGWANESARLLQEGKSVWSIHNAILQSWSITLVIAIVLVAMYGWIMVPFLLIHHYYGWYGLTQANYVEHYGLLRQKLPNGRYELCEPRHSWNTNHIFSNLTSFHLQRHSDHHANALRPYQSLRDFPNLPRLPSGYPGSFVLATIPALWFRVMDRKLLAWAGGDLSKINIDPKRKEAIYARYAQRHAANAPELVNSER
jgi:alkane 1-monooxygenase